MRARREVRAIIFYYFGCWEVRLRGERRGENGEYFLGNEVSEMEL